MTCPGINIIGRLVAIFAIACPGLVLARDDLTTEARAALRRAVEFYHGQVASHGGYVYQYSADLSKREGEGKTGPGTVWVQPPGTPAVGLALLDAYDRTGEPSLLEAAHDAGECLVRGQLRSGAWSDRIDFDAETRLKSAYRVDPPTKKRQRNWSTLDDDKSQSAMRMLMRLDQTLEFKDARIHEAIMVALDAILGAQFPNGAWPQGFQEPAADHPVMAASYPEAWPRKHPGGDYWIYYTFNDNALADTIEMLLMAERIYGEPKYRDAALKGGEFILRAQMPEPQPAWAQQYDFDMHPVWARKFEPPAISGGESQGIIRVLMRLYEETGDPKFLAPICKALDYLDRSALPDGKLARFYELETNKPLYFTREYELTHDDGDLPTHYGFKVGSNVASLRRQYEQLAALSPQKLAARRAERGRDAAKPPSNSAIREVIDSLDDRGAWVEDGNLRYHGAADDTRRIIASATFIRNIELLSRSLTNPPARPNIIIIMPDDQGYGDLGHTGNPIIKTPNIDALAAASVRFTDFHVSPTCAPTRTCIMSGRHEFKSGVTHTILERERMSLRVTTLPQVLKSAGYTTGIFGKWHLGDEDAYQPGKRGFDEVFIHGAGGIGQTYAGSCGDAPGNKYFDPVIRHNGRFVKTEGYCTDVFFQQAAKWIERVKDEQPFFCYLTPNAPHGPLDCPPDYERPYAGQVPEPVAKFYGMITNIDDNVGRLRETLRRLGLEQNTLVIFMTDNGSATGSRIHNAGMRGAKGTPYNGGTRVPSFWSWPGTLRPADVSPLTCHWDILPTLAEIAGARLEGDVASQVEGRSLVPLLREPSAPWSDRYFFTHVGRWPHAIDPKESDDLAKFTKCSVRWRNYTLVSMVDKGPAKWELYDLGSDPGEAKSIAAERPDVVREMAAAYDVWWADLLPRLENERVEGPAVNPFKEAYWGQFQGPGPNNVPRP